MDSVHESLLTPSLEELRDDIEEPPFMEMEEAKDLSTDRIKRILAGEEINSFLDRADLEEVLLRRAHEGSEGVPYLYILPFIAFLSLIAFFGWKLYKSIKEKEKKKEEKKKLKQKKKK